MEVLYDENDPFRPPFKEFEVFTVYSVSIGGESVRSYDDVAKAWNGDNQFGRYFGIFIIVAGLGCTFIALNKKFTQS